MESISPNPHNPNSHNDTVLDAYEQLRGYQCTNTILQKLEQAQVTGRSVEEVYKQFLNNTFFSPTIAQEYEDAVASGDSYVAAEIIKILTAVAKLQLKQDNRGEDVVMLDTALNGRYTPAVKHYQLQGEGLLQRNFFDLPFAQRVLFIQELERQVIKAKNNNIPLSSESDTQVRNIISLLRYRPTDLGNESSFIQSLSKEYTQYVDHNQPVVLQTPSIIEQLSTTVSGLWSSLRQKTDHTVQTLKEAARVPKRAFDAVSQLRKVASQAREDFASVSSPTKFAGS